MLLKQESFASVGMFLVCRFVFLPAALSEFLAVKLHGRFRLGLGFVENVVKALQTALGGVGQPRKPPHVDIALVFEVDPYAIRLISFVDLKIEVETVLIKTGSD